MKKMQLPARLLSLFLVIAMLLSFAVPVNATGTGEEAADSTASLNFRQVDSNISLETVNAAEEIEDMPDYADGDVVRVSIILEEPSTIGAGFSTQNIAQNAAAMSYRDGLKQEQASVTGRIEAATAKELNVVWNLTLAANIISANVTYGEIEDILKVPGVKDVVVETQYEPCVASVDEADPNTATSSEMIGSGAAWAAGYTGAGSRIAVIDTGIDTDHQSFSAGGFQHSLAYRAGLEGRNLDDYLESLNLLDAAEVAAVADQLNVSVNPEKTYVSSKIPFAYNYVDGNYDITHDNDTQGEHGSHVEGIAAANAFIPNEDGSFSSALESVKVQGVAPDAQILTMKVFGNGGGAHDSDYMAAIEDAIILGADSINLSLGSANPGFTRNSTAAYQAILESLPESGTVVAIAVGNSYSWPTYAHNIGYLYSDDVSMDTVGSPGSFTNSLAVASIDNAGYTGWYLTVGDAPVFYQEGNGPRNNPMTSLSGEQAYIYLDSIGTEEEFAAIAEALAGKIAVCSRGTTSFYQKANAATRYGAIATVIYNNAAGTISMDLSNYIYTQPCVSITQADGQILKNNATPVTDAEGNVLYYEGSLTVGTDIDTVMYENTYNTMSSFSSWGVSGSLELKPEITAPGGSIYSVYGSTPAGGGSDQYETLSGTSMASPQVAGMAAVIAQYIRENGLEEKTGLSARQLAQSLLMSTAVPQREEESGGEYYPVLQQGAGLANVASAITAESYILMAEDATASYADGKVKAELGDDPDRTGSYRFRFSVNNLTGETQSYTLATDLFTQDLFTQEGETYMDTWTTLIPANIRYTVDGVAFVPTAVVECDLDRDGDTDADDAQIILNYAAGLTESIDEIADVDGDGKITTYDAYLLLDSLETKAFHVPTNGSAEITVELEIPESAKEYLDAHYTNGAYVEGYVYVKPVTTLEGVVPVTHSIPILGFYGNWSDPSMFDQVSYTSFLYGDTTVPYTGITETNNLLIKRKGSSGTYYQTGNPYMLEEPYPADRAAINSNDTLYQYLLSVIRNAAALTYVITDEDGHVIAMGNPNNQISGAYYYVNGGFWQNTSAALTMSRKVSSLDVEEGDVINVSIVAVPEYYENGADLTSDDLVALIESGTLGKGAFLTTTLTVDNTAPQITGISKDLMTGNIIVTATDNEYIATVALLSKSGSVLTSALPEQNAAGETTSTTFDLSDMYIGQQCVVVVADYAGNETAYLVDYKEASEDYIGNIYAFSSYAFRGEERSWLKINPDTLYYYDYTHYEGTETIASTGISVSAAEYVDGYVFMTGRDSYFYVAPQDDLSNIEKIGNLQGYAFYDMAFSYVDNKLYALDSENTIYSIDLLTGTPTKEFTISFINSKPTSRPQQILLNLAVDDDGNFYAVDYGTNAFLYTWSAEDIVDGAVTDLAPISTTPTGYRNSPFGSALAWDHDNDILYWANCASYGASIENYLLTLDVETGVATKVNTTYAGGYDSAVYGSSLYCITTGLYIVPSAKQYVPPTDTASSLTISDTELTMLKGGMVTLTAAVSPWTLTDRTVTWTSSDDAVVTVDNGLVQAVGTGEATITATTNAKPYLTATCQVTVENVPEIRLSGAVYDADGYAYWSEFTTADPAAWNPVSSKSISVTAGTLLGETLYVHDGSDLYGIDPDVYSYVNYGTIASSWLWSDAAAAPATEDGLFNKIVGLCCDGTYLEMINPEEGTLSYWNLSTIYAEDPMAVIAHIGSGTYTYINTVCPANFYYVLTEGGELWKFTIYTYNGGSSYTCFRKDLGNTGLNLTDVSTVTGGVYASMEYDEETGYLLLSTYSEGDTAELWALDPNSLIPAKIGEFGKDVKPVVSLYQYERVTDLILSISDTAAELFAGETITLSVTTKPSSFTGGVTWSSSDPSVATVDADGVVTGLKEGAAVITATSVDRNQAGEQISVSCAVTVKGLVSVDTVFHAQIATDDGAKWVTVDTANLTAVTTDGTAATTINGGAHDGKIYGSDCNFTANGSFWQIDPSDGYAEVKGGISSSSYAVLDLSTAPVLEVEGTDLFGYPIYISNAQYLIMLTNFETSKINYWMMNRYGFTDMAAIAYVGDTVFTDEDGIDRDAHNYYILCADGSLYQFLTFCTDASSEQVSYGLAWTLVDNIGMAFSDYRALSMTYVEWDNGNEYGFIVADSSNGADLYYIDMAAETLSLGKIGSVPGATGISSLYTNLDLTGKLAAAAEIRKGTEEVCSTPVALSTAYAPTEVVSEKLNTAVGNEVTGSTNALTVSAASKSRVAETNSIEATPTDGTVTLTLTEDQDVTNGLIRVSYDPEVLTYASVSTLIANYAVNVDAENGTILFDYATATAVKSNQVLAALSFTYTDSFIDTEIQVTTLERNRETNLNESVTAAVTYEQGEHDYVVTDSKDPTCTEAGYITYTCSKCGDSYTETADALGHNWSGWTVTTAPNCFHDGAEARTCDRCGETETRSIPAGSDNCPSKAFTDLDTRRWYHEGVDYALTKGLMVGVTDTSFRPDSNLTRAQMITVLYRLAGTPKATEETPFTDVAAGSYYADAVAWAYENQIVMGVTDTLFAPTRPVTREQLVTLIYRYAERNGVNVKSAADLSTYPDAGSVSNYAVSAMSWAVENGIIVGIGNNLAPKSTATRAQIAVILLRYDQAFG